MDKSAKLDLKSIKVSVHLFLMNCRSKSPRLNDKLHCDVFPIPRNFVDINPGLKECSFFATLAWIGKKPVSAKERMTKKGEASKEIRCGKISLLIKDDDGVATTGTLPLAVSIAIRCHKRFERTGMTP